MFRFRSPSLAEALEVLPIIPRGVPILQFCESPGMSQKEIDHAIRTTFRNPPILASEDRAQYAELKRLVLSDIKPRGLQETLLARDIVEAEWEVCRLRWMKVAILHAVLPRVIKSRILEAGGTRSLDRRLVPKICKHVAAVVAGVRRRGNSSKHCSRITN
jgi:hypothetical protein